MKRALLIAVATLLAAALFLRFGDDLNAPAETDETVLESTRHSADELNVATSNPEDIPLVTHHRDTEVDSPEAPGNSPDCFKNVLKLSPPLTAAQETQWSEDFSARTLQATELIKSSGLHEHLHVSALMTWRKPEKLELLMQSLKQDPNNVMTLWHALKTCSESKDKGACPLREWEYQLSSLAPDNSQVWMRIALNRYQDNQPTEALIALQRAGTARESTVYWSERMGLYESTLGSTGLLSRSEAYLLALGSTESRAPEHKKYGEMCASESALSDDWAEACLAYGASAANSNLPKDALKAANQIQYHALESLGRGEEATQVFEEFNDRYELFKRREADMTEELGRLLFANSDILLQVLTEIKEQGEMQGFDNMYTQLQEMSRINENDECVPLLGGPNHLD